MLAKAVAHHTTAAFIRVVGSEFVQKYLGEVTLSVQHVQCCLQIGKLHSPASDCPVTLMPSPDQYQWSHKGRACLGMHLLM
jgi:hypothetical protein